MKMVTLPLLCLLLSCLGQVRAEAGLADDFQPVVSVVCVGGSMTITVATQQPFYGVVHGRNRSEPGCSVQGSGGLRTRLRVDLSVAEGSPGSCGVRYNPNTEERTIGVGVRAHNQIELLEDRLYHITCGKAGFQNRNNETSLVTLQLLREGRKVQQVVYGRDYTLKAHISQPDGTFGMKVKRCFSFSDQNSTVELVDERGCPEPTIMSEFSYNRVTGTVEARLFSMFKFPDSNRVHFQCDIVICKGDCEPTNCEDSTEAPAAPQARLLCRNHKHRHCHHRSP